MAYQHLWRRLMGGNATDADFRAWGGGMSAAIQALGWVKTADTGQIDWSTVTRPLANGQKMGYEIYRAADSLQASAPWYIRFDYGADPNAATRPGLDMQFGTGTNGAGTLTGAGTKLVMSQNVQQTAQAQWLFVGDGTLGLLGIIAGVVTGAGITPVWAFYIERSQTKGVPDNRGAVILLKNNSGNYRLNTNAALWGQAVASMAAMTLATSLGPVRAGHYDTGSIVQAVFYNLGNCFLAGPMHNVFLVDPSAVPIGLVTDVPHDGAAESYYVSDAPDLYPSQEPSATTTPFKFAFRWD